MHAFKLGPSRIRRVSEPETGTVGIGPTGADEDGANVWETGGVGGECEFHSAAAFGGAYRLG